MRLSIGFFLGVSFTFASLGYEIADRAEECAFAHGVDRCKLALVPVSEVQP